MERSAGGSYVMAALAMAWARTVAPFRTSLQVVCYAGECLLPPVDGTKISPAGKCRAKV